MNGLVSQTPAVAIVTPAETTITMLDASLRMTLTVYTSLQTPNESYHRVLRGDVSAAMEDVRNALGRPVSAADLRSELGEIDIYLFDQILRGRFDGRRTVLDAGCGDGRNLVYLLRRGVACYGIDHDDAAIARVRGLASRIAPALPGEHFQVGRLDDLPWDDGSMDAVICSAVLHFATDRSHFARMLQELWRVLAADGLLFVRTASTIGLERLIGSAAGQRVQLPDGTERFVVDEAILLDWTDRLGGQLLDPIKTTNVQQQRCMTTWCVRKPSASSAESQGLG